MCYCVHLCYFFFFFFWLIEIWNLVQRLKSNSAVYKVSQPSESLYEYLPEKVQINIAIPSF